MNNVKHVVLVLASLCAIGLTACKKDPGNAEHDAAWYLANGPELQKKLGACQADPVAAKADVECAAATNAFLTWYAASGQQAAQDRKDASMDGRLAAPTPDTAAPASTQGTAPSEAAPADGAPATDDPSKTSP